jgi:hypothetical protein
MALPLRDDLYDRLFAVPSPDGFTAEQIETTISIVLEWLASDDVVEAMAAETREYFAGMTWDSFRFEYPGYAENARKKVRAAVAALSKEK